MSKLTKLKPIVRLSVVNPDTESNSVFGRGIASLCIGVRDTGSLNAAAKSMGMAYSKAWRIIKDTEAALDVQLLYRDGAHGSSLPQNRGCRQAQQDHVCRMPCPALYILYAAREKADRRRQYRADRFHSAS